MGRLCGLITNVVTPVFSFPHQSVWVRKGSLRWWRDWKPQRWVDVGVALEQSTKADGKKDSIFFVYYSQYDEKKVGFTVVIAPNYLGFNVNWSVCKYLTFPH